MIAIVKFGFLVDRYVALLDATGESMVIGDTLTGKELLSRQEFEQRWRRCGLVVSRRSR